MSAAFAWTWFFLSAILAAQLRTAATRHYYIATEDVTWDYASSQRDQIHGAHLPLPWSQQTEWAKTRFREYTDSTFSVAKPQPEWLGILGPILRAQVGDTLVVEFLNRSRRVHGIHPHGLRYEKSSEGAHYVPSGTGSLVLASSRCTYTWLADAGSGPGPPTPVPSFGGTTRTGLSRTFKRDPHDDTGRFYAINGDVFGNLPGLTVRAGSRVRWYLMGMGGEQDFDTPHWHGKAVEYQNRHADVIELLPATTATVDMAADNPVTWLFHCQDSPHGGRHDGDLYYLLARSELLPGRVWCGRLLASGQ